MGASEYSSAELVDLPAVRRNLEDLRALLIDPAYGGLPADRCEVVLDPVDGVSVYRRIAAAARESTDTFVLYFAGHGRVDQRGDLHLCLAGTDVDALKVSALAYDLVRELLTEMCPADNRVVIIDSCFAGRAVSTMAGDDPESWQGEIDISGTYVLAAVPRNSKALASPGARNTAFTGMLLDLLREGTPSGQAYSTFGELYPRLVSQARQRAYPKPIQSIVGSVAGLALSRNPRYDGTPVPPVSPVAPPSREDASLAATVLAVSEIEQKPRVDLAERLDDYDLVLRPLITAIARDLAEHDGIEVVVELLATRTSVGPPMPRALLPVRAYPGLLAGYAVGIAALYRKDEVLVDQLLVDQDLLRTLALWRVVDPLKVLPNGTVSAHLRTVLAPSFTSRMDFERVFEEYEYLRSLLEYHHLGTTSLGEFARDLARGRTTVASRVLNRLRARPPRWDATAAAQGVERYAKQRFS
nr:caspase family protein [Actinokineospora cianjurensis]